MNARTIARTAAATLTAVLAAAGAVATAAPASAVPIPLKPAVTVTVSGPTARVAAEVMSPARTTARGGHLVTLAVGGSILWGSSPCGDPRPVPVVRVAGTVPSRTLIPGTTTATVTDVGDGSTATVKVTVLRRSLAQLDRVIPLGDGTVLVTGRVRHYDLTTGTYKGDQASTVAVQVLAGNRWVAVAESGTYGPDGAVAAVVPVSGPTLVRIVRAPGATVTGGSSTPRLIPAA